MGENKKLANAELELRVAQLERKVEALQKAVDDMILEQEDAGEVER